jgi:ribonuclease Z
MSTQLAPIRRRRFNPLATLALLAALTAASSVQAAPCLIVTLTGTQSGPAAVNGLAGAGTLIRYGDESNGCGALKLQFDAGRGTTQRLSQLGITPVQLDAVFLTHMHSDHTEGLPDLMLLRWMYWSKADDIELVCGTDAPPERGHSLSCTQLARHLGDPFLASGEIAERYADDPSRRKGGPADLVRLKTFTPAPAAQTVWSRGDVRVSAIRSTHTADHVSYRVDTPAGSVVIGGDAGNDTLRPPRASSTSAQVEQLAEGAQVIVHSTMHPVMAPGGGSGMPDLVYYRQSLAGDLGAMAKRTGAQVLMLTHLAPSLGSNRHGPFSVPGGPLTVADYQRAVAPSGFAGEVIVGEDLASVRLPRPGR